ASKTQVMRMTQKLLGMKKPVTPSHAADALGCAIAALLSRNTPSLHSKKTEAKRAKSDYQINERT
ncbi:MAG: crossover junction endodeoxyribonuclease RuvC, partial [Candidatus Poribacteria bacterium]|nr:crossover junction endodeoxyribonuclease RuvC [Candidatus Poribacteria bacterium]